MRVGLLALVVWLGLAGLARAQTFTRPLTVEQGGVTIGTRPILNFVAGATCVDNPGGNRVDCTMTGGGGGTGTPGGAVGSVQFNLDGTNFGGFGSWNSGTSFLTVPGTLRANGVQDKGVNGQVYNVVAYGADPTGAVDATTSIGTAVSTAQAAGGGVIYFPPGTYLVSDPSGLNKGAIPIYGGLTYLGAGGGNVAAGTSLAGTTIETLSTAGTAYSIFGSATPGSCTGGAGACDATLQTNARGAGCVCTTDGATGGDCTSGSCALGTSQSQAVIQGFRLLVRRDKCVGIDMTTVSESKIRDVSIFESGTPVATIGVLFGDSNNGMTRHPGYSNLLEASHLSTLDTCVRIINQGNNQYIVNNSFSNLCGTAILVDSDPTSTPPAGGNRVNSTRILNNTIEGETITGVDDHGVGTLMAHNRFEFSSISTQPSVILEADGESAQLTDNFFSPNGTGKPIQDNGMPFWGGGTGRGSYQTGRAVGTTMQGADNLLPDGTLESWSDVNTLRGWKSASGTSWELTGNLVQEATIKRFDGSFSAKVGDGATAGKGIASATSYPIDPTEPYTLSYWWTAPTTSNGHRLCVRLCSTPTCDGSPSPAGLISTVDCSTAANCLISRSGVPLGNNLENFVQSNLPFNSSFNANCGGTNITTQVAATLERRVTLLQFPAGVQSARIMVWASPTAANAFAYFDDMEFMQGPTYTRGYGHALTDAGDQTVYGSVSAVNFNETPLPGPLVTCAAGTNGFSYFDTTLGRKCVCGNKNGVCSAGVRTNEPCVVDADCPSGGGGSCVATFKWCPIGDMGRVTCTGTSSTCAGVDPQTDPLNAVNPDSKVILGSSDINGISTTWQIGGHSKNELAGINRYSDMVAVNVSTGGASGSTLTSPFSTPKVLFGNLGGNANASAGGSENGTASAFTVGATGEIGIVEVVASGAGKMCGVGSAFTRGLLACTTDDQNAVTGCPGTTGSNVCLPILPTTTFSATNAWWASAQFRGTGGAPIPQTVTVDMQYENASDPCPGACAYHQVASTTTNTASFIQLPVVFSPALASPFRIFATRWTFTNWTAATNTGRLITLGLHHKSETPFPRYLARDGDVRSKMLGPLAWADDLGATTHLQGPSDRDLTIAPGGTSTGTKAVVVTQNFEDKAGQVFNVLAYGADNTGTNATQAAIQTANDTAAGNGTVFFPCGTYKITAPLLLKFNNVHWKGAGACTVIQQATGATDGVQNGSGGRISGVLLEDLSLSCAPLIACGVGLNLTDVTDSRFSRIDVLATTNLATAGFVTGVKVFSTTSLGAFRNRFYDLRSKAAMGAGNVALLLDGSGAPFGANSTLVIGGALQADQGEALKIVQADQSVFEGITFEGGSLRAVHVTSPSARAAFLQGNRFENTSCGAVPCISDGHVVSVATLPTAAGTLYTAGDVLTITPSGGNAKCTGANTPNTCCGASPPGTANCNATIQVSTVGGGGNVTAFLASPVAAGFIYQLGPGQATTCLSCANGGAAGATVDITSVANVGVLLDTTSIANVVLENGFTSGLATTYFDRGTRSFLIEPEETPATGGSVFRMSRGDFISNLGGFIANGNSVQDGTSNEEFQARLNTNDVRGRWFVKGNGDWGMGPGVAPDATNEEIIFHRAATGQMQLTTGAVAMNGTSVGLTPGFFMGANTGTGKLASQSGDPSGVVPAPQGSLFGRTDGSTGTSLYAKEGNGSGTGGWAPVFTWDATAGTARVFGDVGGVVKADLASDTVPSPGALFQLTRSRGTQASRTAVGANDELGGFTGVGRDDVAFPTTSAAIRMFAGEAFVNATNNHGGFMDFQTLANATNASASTKMRLLGNGHLLVGPPLNDVSGAELVVWNGDIALDNNAANSAGKFKFFERAAHGSHFSSFEQADLTPAVDVTYKLPPAQGGASTFLNNDGAGNLTWVGATVTTHNLLSTTHPDTDAASPVLGDIIAANGTPHWQRVAGNTTAGAQFLQQTGTGAVSALPVWHTLVASDVGSGQALTMNNTDTNLTVIASGTPATALLQGVTLTPTWAGTLSVTRGGTGGSAFTGHFPILGEGALPMNSVAGGCTTGQALTCNANGTADPTFQNSGGFPTQQTVSTGGDIKASDTIFSSFKDSDSREAAVQMPINATARSWNNLRCKASANVGGTGLTVTMAKGACGAQAAVGATQCAIAAGASTCGPINSAQSVGSAGDCVDWQFVHTGGGTTVQVVCTVEQVG